MNCTPVPTFRPCRPGERPTHFHDFAAGITAPLESYRTIMDTFRGGHADCVLQGVMVFRKAFIPVEDGFGRDTLAQMVDLADEPDYCSSCDTFGCLLDCTPGSTRIAPGRDELLAT